MQRFMQRLFALILVIGLWFGLSLSTAPAAYAEFSFNALTPCGSSAAFKENLSSQISGYEARLAKFDKGSAPASYLSGKIEATKARFAKYADSGLLCGDDGLPHLITDGRWDHANEFIIPSLIFLYITGWIGWVGRGYLRAIKKGEDAANKEVVIDVPLALQFALTGFIWPVAALQQFSSGELTAPENEVTVSPR